MNKRQHVELGVEDEGGDEAGGFKRAAPAQYLLVARLLEGLDESVHGPEHAAAVVLADLGHDLVAEHLHVWLRVSHALYRTANKNETRTKDTTRQGGVFGGERSERENYSP